MKTSKKVRIPSLRCCNNRGFVQLNGRRVYLGPWGTPETKEAYERAISEWLANKQLPRVDADQITITELCRDYWVMCQEYYVKPNGDPTSTLDSARQAMKPLRGFYGSTLANDFGPNALRSLRNHWIEQGLSRRTVEYYVAFIKRLFKWAASHERIRIEVYQSLATLESLKAGRSNVKETKPVQPVIQSHINAIEPYLSSQVWALIQLQLLTATRAGELLKLRPCDLNVSRDVWTAVLSDHKTSYRGGKRTIYFGPKAQNTLRVFMDGTGIQEYLFSPKKAEIERHSKADSHRRSDQKQNPTSTNRVVGEFYTTASYRRSISRACKKAGIPAWTPHRLRHNSATFIRREYGLEAAQVILGHSQMDVTQIYAVMLA